MTTHGGRAGNDKAVVTAVGFSTDPAVLAVAGATVCAAPRPWPHLDWEGDD